MLVPKLPVSVGQRCHHDEMVAALTPPNEKADDDGKSKGEVRAIVFILVPCEFVILSDQRERRIPFLSNNSTAYNEILRRFPFALLRASAHSSE